MIIYNFVINHYLTTYFCVDLSNQSSYSAFSSTNGKKIHEIIDRNIIKINKTTDFTLPTILPSENILEQISFTIKKINEVHKNCLNELIIEIIVQQQMPKQVIISMYQNYPFGECEECTSEQTRVLVRKIYQASVHQHSKLMQKVNILRKLKSQQMIKIESVLEEQESIHFLFEYIPIKLQTWISNINDQFIENFRDQLIKFSSFLANNFIKIEFQLKNIGMDQNYGAKYFLDINFELDPTLNREKLKSNYIRQITNLFKPYILNLPKVKSSADSDREAAKSREQPPKIIEVIRKQEPAISPPTNKAHKSKEKALEKYYQEVNMSVDSQNQKILQEFMDVLENQAEEAPAKPAPPRQQSQANNSPYQKITPNYQNANVSNQNGSNHHQHHSSSNQIFSQKQLPFKNQAQAVSYSTKNILQPKQNERESSVAQRQVQNTRPNTTLSMGKTKADGKQMSEMWRQSADLQNRVKSAIQKSMSVIKRFKAIKQSIHG